MIKTTLAAIALAAAASAHAESRSTSKPTVVLVHGAFADGSSWNEVAGRLREAGYPVIAAANPLRGVAADSLQIGALVQSIAGPVVLVGHSYGGPVISAAAETTSNVRALVYVAAFAPEVGESIVGINTQFPGSTLGDALAAPVAQPSGEVDLYIDRDRFAAQFAADVPVKVAASMATAQRPVAKAALEEAATAAAWKHLPVFSIYGDADRNISPAAMAYMADRARSQQTIVIRGGSHALMVSHPRAVAKLIEQAAGAR